MIEAVNATDQKRPGHWKCTRGGLILLSLSAAIGVFFWLTAQGWYVGALAAVSFWIVLGLSAQARDIWSSSKNIGALPSDERWGLRFALAWRIAICFLIGIYFLLRLSVGLHFIKMDNVHDGMCVSTQEMWDAVLLVSMIAAIAGSLGIGRKVWRRPWSWAIAVFRGFVAGFLFLMLLESLLLVSYLVHITIVGILLAQPLQYSTDVAYASSFARISQFYDIATAGAISVLVSCILLWQLSVRWRAAWPHRVCLGILLGVSLTVMILLTVRIAVVEIPTISPIMAAHFRVPAPFQLATGAVLMVMLTTAVARRWSEPQWSGNATGIAVWRREEKRYYHERRSLILILGGVALAKCIEGAVALAEMWYGFFKQGSALVWTFWDSIGSFLTYPTGCLSLALILLVLHVAFSGRLKRTDALAMEQPRLSPGIFLIVWFSALTIIVCSAPILASWHFASFMRSGYIH